MTDSGSFRTVRDAALMDPDTSTRTRTVLWILEHLWARGRTELLRVDYSRWPELDWSRPLSLEDPLSLRVAAAKAYSIVRSRDLWRFETVMSFLEATFRLLPGLVAPIKHMKIVFGLKTMVIMWMLKERRSLIETVSKANQFFPHKLLQYQDQCSQREMFLMRRNHMDFKALTQTLAMDQEKLEDYIKNQMEQQYGQRYAQKVEDRLLDYLCQLEMALPQQTYISTLLKMDRPLSEEEGWLLHVIGCDCSTMAAAVHTLLHTGVGSSSPAQHEPNQENSLLLVDSSKTFPVSACDQAARDLSKDSPHLFDDEDSQVGRRPPTDGPNCDLLRERRVDDGGLTNVAALPEESQGHVSAVERLAEKQGEVNAESKGGHDVVSPSPQFCSRHERWVDSILQECPDDCSEELLLHKNMSVSPPLFQSSSSVSSSHDLTPSDLSPCPSVQQHLLPQTSFHPQVSSQTSELRNSEDTPRSGSTVLRSQREPRPVQCSSRLMSPLVRLVDIASVKGVHQEYKPQRASPSNFTMSTKEHTPPASSTVTRTSPSCRNPTNKDANSTHTQTVSPSNQPNTTDRRDTLPVSHVPTTSACCPPPATRSSSRLSHKLKQFSGPPGPYSQKALPDSFGKAPPTVQMTSPLSPTEPTPFGSQVTPDSRTPVSLCGGHLAKPSSGKVHQVTISVQSQSHTYDLRPSEPQTRPLSTLIFSASNSPSDSVRTSGTTLRLSLQSQAVLLQSKLLQPFVRLTRLDPQDHHMVTRSPVPRKVLLEEEDKEDSLLDASFDVAALYSSHSSGSDSEDSRGTDPDYRPHVKKKKFLLQLLDVGEPQS